MDDSRKILEIAKRIRALARNGSAYSPGGYDAERYGELELLAQELMSTVTDTPAEKISDWFIVESDYVTPKVDVRAVVFDDRGRILLVKEKADGLWSLPGGWADVGFTPSEVAVKEVREETGLEAEAVKLLAVHDKKCHAHPPALHYAYKIFILCRITGGQLHNAFDILDTGFFAPGEIPPLSTERVTQQQIDLMFEYLASPDKEAETD